MWMPPYLVAVVAVVAVAGVVFAAAALLPCARRDRAALADADVLTPLLLRRAALDDHGDVAGALADPVRATLRARPDALGGGALVGVDGGDHQRGRVQSVVVLRVGGGAGDHLGDRLAGRLRRPPQDVEGFLDALAADQVDDAARLAGRDAARAGDRRRADGIFDRQFVVGVLIAASLFRSSLM